MNTTFSSFLEVAEVDVGHFTLVIVSFPHGILCWFSSSHRIGKLEKVLELGVVD